MQRNDNSETMKSTNVDDLILNQIIIGYRELIAQRYQHESLQNKYTLPVTMDKHLVTRLRTYFLEYVYPDIEKRAELNEAFNSLNDYIENPKKLIRIILDSSKLLFTYGIHLPKILKTGLKALSTYRTATKFEYALAEKAIENQISPPFDISKIKNLLHTISRKEINAFIESCTLLFKTLHDRKLMKNVNEILSYLIKKMKDRTNIYSQSEIKGLEFGMELLIKGNLLFNQLTSKDQQSIVELIIEIETDALNGIYNDQQY